LYSSVKEPLGDDEFAYSVAKDVPLIDFTESNGKSLYDNSGNTYPLLIHPKPKCSVRRV